MKRPLLIQEIGSLKKPEWLVSILKNKRATPEQKERARNDAAYLNIRMLEDAGLDIIYDGEARRVEMYEYAAKNIHGTVFSGRVRSWDNRYYRKARVVDKLQYKGCYHLDELKFVKQHARKIVKIPITGPYTMADWSYNEYYQNKEDLVMDFAKEIIRPLCKDLVRAGAEIIQIDEPAATTHPAEMDIFVQGFNEVVKGIDATFTVHICYSGNNYAALFPTAMEMKTDQFTLEFANRDTWEAGVTDQKRIGYGALKSFREHGSKAGVGLGVLDVHVDKVEDPKIVRDRILYAVKVLDDPRLVDTNPDCGLRTRSREVAFAKLHSLTQGTRMARKELGISV